MCLYYLVAVVGSWSKLGVCDPKGLPRSEGTTTTGGRDALGIRREAGEAIAVIW